MVAVDHFTRRGWGKRVCADAVGVVGDRLVLADGCSSAPQSDLGARLLVRAAGSIRTALAWAEAIELPPDALDATCLTAHLDADGVAVEIIGDGVVVARTRDGALCTWRVEYPSNAPAYPLLHIDAARRAAWTDRFGDARTIHGPDGIEQAPGYAALRWRFAWDAYDRVALFSDGVTALERCVTTDTGRHFEPVALDAALEELMAVPHPRGAFVERRVRRLFDRTGWRARDDFAMGMWACA